MPAYLRISKHVPPKSSGGELIAGDDLTAGGRFPMRGVMPVQMMLAEVLPSQFDTPAHDA